MYYLNEVTKVAFHTNFDVVCNNCMFFTLNLKSRSAFGLTWPYVDFSKRKVDYLVASERIDHWRRKDLVIQKFKRHNASSQHLLLRTRPPLAIETWILWHTLWKISSHTFNQGGPRSLSRSWLLIFEILEEVSIYLDIKAWTSSKRDDITRTKISQ